MMSLDGVPGDQLDEDNEGQSVDSEESVDPPEVEEVDEKQISISSTQAKSSSATLTNFSQCHARGNLKQLPKHGPIQRIISKDGNVKQYSSTAPKISYKFPNAPSSNTGKTNNLPPYSSKPKPTTHSSVGNKRQQESLTRERQGTQPMPGTASILMQPKLTATRCQKPGPSVSLPLAYRNLMSVSSHSQPCCRALPSKIKLTFFVVNVVFFGCGVGVLALGVVTVLGQDGLLARINVDAGGNLQTSGLGVLDQAAITMATGGTLVGMLGLLGCAAMVQDSALLLKAYAALVTLLVMLQISGASLAFVFRGAVTEKLDQQLLGSLQKHYDGQFNSSSAFSRAVDYIHVFFSCCGIFSWEDFQNSPWGRLRKAETIAPDDETLQGNNSTVGNGSMWIRFPITCCRLRNKDVFLDNILSGSVEDVELFDPQCPHRLASRDNAFTGFSCVEAMVSFVSQKANVLIYIALGAIALEYSGIIIALSMAADMTEDSDLL